MKILWSRTRRAPILTKHPFGTECREEFGRGIIHYRVSHSQEISHLLRPVERRLALRVEKNAVNYYYRDITKWERSLAFPTATELPMRVAIRAYFRVLMDRR